MNTAADIARQETTNVVALLGLPAQSIDAIADQVVAKLEPRLAELEALIGQASAPRWMNSKQAAEYLAIPWDTFRVSPERWGGVKEGRGYVYDRIELDRIRVERRQREAA